MSCTYLIANYNNSKYLKGCLESALAQTYPCKICFIDDCSTDSSLEIALETLFGGDYKSTEEEYVKYTDGKHTVIQLEKNEGPSYARNCGIRETLAGTQFYAVLDADDENYPTKVEKCIKVMEEDPHIGIVYADYDILNVDTGNTVREYKYRYSHSHLLKECIIHSGAVFRAGLLNKVVEPSGWYDINLRCVEDMDLWLRMTQHTLAYHIPQSLSLVRTHREDSTRSVNKEVWQKCWQTVQQKLYARNNKTQQHKI